jgi:6-phospho-beta-glucosidase
MLAAHSRVTIEARAIDRSDDLGHFLAGADAVLIQMRVGGYTGRAYDETFPLSFGICGDEGLGPGGLSAAWRAWPDFLDVITAIHATCPRAQVLVLTSPLGLLVRAAHMVFPGLKLAGICELPFTTLLEAADTVGRNWSELEWDYIGVNHIGWFYRIQTSGTEIASPLLPLPLKYVRLHDDAASVLREQQSRSTTRAAQLEDLKAKSIAVYRHGCLRDIEHALNWRNANWYEQAVGPFVSVLAGGSDGTAFFLTIPQSAIYPGFAADDVLEVPHTAVRGQMVPRLCAARPPLRLAETVARFASYERTAARAIIESDAALLMQALTEHPWISKQIALDQLTQAVIRSRTIDSVSRTLARAAT